MASGEQSTHCMARSRFCRICRDFHDLNQAWPSACVGHFGVARHGDGPQIISDTIEPFRSMASGEVFSSKSRYRSDLRARGMVELGNDQPTSRPAAAPPVRDTLRQTIRQLGG